MIDGSEGLKEVFRVFQCEAYNCIVSVISCVQDQEKFYHTFLFKEDPASSEFIWSRLVDDKVELTFPLVQQNQIDEASSLSVKRTKVVAIRSKAATHEADKKVARPHFLGDSSLSQDVTFDFHESVASLDASAASQAFAGKSFYKFSSVGQDIF